MSSSTAPCPAPGASPTTNPTPASVHVPAATSTAALTVPSTLKAPASPKALSPLVAPLSPRGRSKEQRWSDSSPSSLSGGPTASLSFPDALLAGVGGSWPVPMDLRGKCFNSFSPGHCAAACRLRPRCFNCKMLGHRSRECSDRGSAPRPPLRKVWHNDRSRECTDRGAAPRPPLRKVWRRVSSGDHAPAAAGGSKPIVQTVEADKVGAQGT
jgi:hypothetical protein